MEDLIYLLATVRTLKRAVMESRGKAPAGSDPVAKPPGSLAIWAFWSAHKRLSFYNVLVQHKL